MNYAGIDGVQVAGLRAEYRRDSEWVGVDRPRLSWRTVTSIPDWVQDTAEIELMRESGTHVTELHSAESVFVAWPGEPLRSHEVATVRVRVTGAGETSPWSEPLRIRAGFLDAWDAPFLSLPEPRAAATPFLARGEVLVDRPVGSATLHSTAHGLCRVTVNSERVDDHELTPGWTAYRQRLIHETVDVTALLRAGANAIGAEVAGGWYTESYGFGGHDRRVYGDQAAFSAVLRIEYDDGSIETWGTSPEWRLSQHGPLRSSGIYEGDEYDARRKLPGWNLPGFDDSGWEAPVLSVREHAPVARTSEPVRVTERVPVAHVVRSEPGRILVDFGQNLVGRLHVRLRGSAGDRIVLRHAEVLEHGELGTRPLRRAASTDTYICSGDGVEEWAPAFTFHGFRYAEISGHLELDPADVEAIVMHTDMERTGRFTTSHPLIDRLHENVVWSMRGNFVSLPTDCPQRDERMGWTGDIQVFAPAASGIFDCAGLLASWLADLGAEQQASGGVPFIVPDVLDSARFPAAAWGDAATVVPASLHERFGDLGILQHQLASMRDWVGSVLDNPGQRLPWAGRFQFGDWLDPTAPPDRPWDGRTDADLVAGAYLFRSTRLVAASAALLGDADAERYARIAEHVRELWLAEYLTPAGRIVSDSPTGYALAISFEIVRDETMRSTLGDRLLELVRSDGYRIGTGFVGTPLILGALTATGHDAAAGRMLIETEAPSWLYPVAMGATTIWERWDSMLPDGSINPGDMTSFNHYAFGAVADWLHRELAGLASEEPGYRRLRIAPSPIAEVDSAAFELLTPYGPASVRWQAEAGRLDVSAVVPPNTRARVLLPGTETFEVGSGAHAWTVDDPRPDPARPTRASSLSEILDDAGTWRAVLTAARSVQPGFDPLLRGPVLIDRPLGDSFFGPPPVVLTAMLKALDALAGSKSP